ncbi:MAG: hypothetical protein HRU38_07470 [Saccharospirillaceae bacterium]|nr:hypothetical protein [Pseudomonadales bacterium]NRB78491.1 hypothetical protein [Saccharospirillaceae bacterium]
MKYLGLLLLLTSLNLHAFKVVVPAEFQSLSSVEVDQIKQGDLPKSSIESKQQYAFYVFLNALKDQDIELVFIDQQQKAESLLYEAKVAASLFLYENKNDEKMPKSSHFVYSSAIIDHDQWLEGVFTCSKKNDFKSIALMQTDSFLIKVISEQFPKIVVNLHKSWPALISSCVNNGAAIILPLAMVDYKLMNTSVYFSDQYVSIPYSYHIVFSSQNTDAKKLRNIFETRLLEITKPQQGKIQ